MEKKCELCLKKKMGAFITVKKQEKIIFQKHDQLLENVLPKVPLSTLELPNPSHNTSELHKIR